MDDHHPYVQHTTTIARLNQLVSRAEALAKLAAVEFQTCATAFDFADRAAAMFASCDQRLDVVETEIRQILDRVQQLADYQDFEHWPARWNK